jgi:Ca2+-transporting ATPase
MEALELLGGVSEVIKALDVNPEQGLSPDEVPARRTRFGPNTFPEQPPRSFLSFVWDAMQDATLAVLAMAALVSLVNLISDKEGGWHDCVAIIIAISICVFVASWNDYNQSLQFRALNADKRNIQINVLRGGRRDKVSVFDLVVGDIVVLGVGDQIPADGLLLSGQSVISDESAMTGESEPMKKNPATKPFLLSGCKITEGYGEMAVTAVGLNTEWGRIMAVTSEDNDEETPLQVRLDAVATGIGKVGLGVAVIVFIVLFIRNATSGSGKWYDHLINAFIIAVTIIVVAVPEGLPLAVTLSLAYSMKKMMIDKALVRHLSACEAMGGATAICSDKTGTLTTNKMTVVRAWIAGAVSPPEREPSEADTPAAVLPALRAAAFLNTTGSVSMVEGKREVSGSPTEQAILAFAAGLPGPSFHELRAAAPLLHMQPFNSANKTMGVAVKDPESGATRIYWKGASEIVLAACTHALGADGKASPMSGEAIANLEALIDEFAQNALRTLMLAYTELPAGAAAPDWEESGLPFTNLTAVALVGIKDPCRPGVPEAVAACQAAGIIVRMVTGDNIATAKAIAKECGIYDESADHVAMEGPVFREMAREELLQVLPRLRVLARSSPTDKHTLVSLLRSLGEVVAVTGDGTNDAPALHEADIGLAMGIAGTEVAKEASDIIILDDNFASCVRVVRWGRSVYRNIQAFVQFQLTVNITALVLNMICALVGGDIPLTAVQLLWVNMIMDTMGALALATEPPTDGLMLRKPYGRTEPIINNVMWRNMLAMAAFQLTVLFVMFFRGCNLLEFGFADERLSPVGGYCDDFPHVSMGNSTGVELLRCLDRTHGCPPRSNEDVDGTIFDMHARLEFHDYITLTCTIFNTFVFMQVFNEINARSMEKFNVFSGLFTNNIFMAVLAFTGFAQWIIIQFAGDFAQTTPLRWQHWIISIIIGIVTLPVAFFVKFIRVPETPTLPEVIIPKFLRAKIGVSESAEGSPGEEPHNVRRSESDARASAVSVSTPSVLRQHSVSAVATEEPEMAAAV